MNKETKPAITYIDQLTWLRGWAAFLVVVSHCLRATEVTYFPDDSPATFFLARWLDLGTFGVMLFFALSGCTLYISNQSRLQWSTVPSFYIKRVLRIWPAFAVSLLLYVLFGYVFAESYIEPKGLWVEKQFLAPFSGMDVIKYLGLVFNLTGPSGLFNNAYWSLPVEFQYYLIFPVLVAAIRLVGWIGPTVIALGLYFFPRLGIIDIASNQVFTLSLSFCGGVVVGYLYHKISWRAGWLVGAGGVVLGLVAVSGVSNQYITIPDVPMISNLWNFYAIVATMMVFIVLFSRFSLNDRLQAFLHYYGTISYSTYLYHNLFIAIAILIVVNTEWLTGNSQLAFVFCFAMVTTYYAAKLSYTYIEKTFIDLGRKLV